MKQGIHPKTQAVSYICNSCSSNYKILSTSDDDIKVEVCSNCHPFYTGEEGIIVDTYSRVDKFKKAQEAADTSKVTKKKKKAARRKRSKVSETKSDSKVTLRDMLQDK